MTNNTPPRFKGLYFEYKEKWPKSAVPLVGMLTTLWGITVDNYEVMAVGLTIYTMGSLVLGIQASRLALGLLGDNAKVWLKPMMSQRQSMTTSLT